MFMTGGRYVRSLRTSLCLVYASLILWQQVRLKRSRKSWTARLRLAALSQDMKRPHDLEDAGDKARKHMKPCSMRIPLDQIGFWPGHRDGLGISSHHVQMVAWELKDCGTILERYEHVDLVEIPQDMLQEIRDANRDRCESDNRMPRFSPHMTYVCVSKTHFVHAQKLAKEGNRSMFNKGDVNIRWQD